MTRTGTWRRTLLCVALAVPFAARADCPPCGEMTCVNDPAFQKARDEKKAKLRRTFSAERVALVDRDGPCLLCLEKAPDWFTVLVQRPNGAIEVSSWTDDQEKYAKQDLATGKAKVAYIVYARKRCACCKEPPPEQQADWDAKLGLSKSLAVQLEP